MWISLSICVVDSCTYRLLQVLTYVSVGFHKLFAEFISGFGNYNLMSLFYVCYSSPPKERALYCSGTFLGGFGEVWRTCLGGFWRGFWDMFGSIFGGIWEVSRRGFIP